MSAKYADNLEASLLTEPCQWPIEATVHSLMSHYWRTVCLPAAPEVCVINQRNVQTHAARNEWGAENWPNSERTCKHGGEDNSNDDEQSQRLWAILRNPLMEEAICEWKMERHEIGENLWNCLSKWKWWIPCLLYGQRIVSFTCCNDQAKLFIHWQICLSSCDSFPHQFRRQKIHHFLSYFLGFIIQHLNR